MSKLCHEPASAHTIACILQVHCGFAVERRDDYTNLQMATSSGTTPNSRPGLVVSAVGPDRPGLVRELSSFIHEHGGNIEDTRMSKLGGEFAVLVLATGKDDDLLRLEAALPGFLAQSGLLGFAKHTEANPSGPPTRHYQLEVSGLDRAGIVQKVSALLVARGINVTSFESRVEHAPHSGTPVFLMDAQIDLPEDVDVLALEKELENACARDQLEFILNRI